MSSSILWVGMDVHKEMIAIAVYRGRATQPLLEERLPNECHRLRRFFQRLARQGQIRACYEASGAGYVVQRWLEAWGYGCEVMAPGLIPKKPSERRKCDRYDAKELAHLYRAGELTAVHIPTEAEERVGDLVRCRETFQREIVKSRHYLLKFLRRHGYVYREGEHWTSRHWQWLRRIYASQELVGQDQVVVGEYLALLEYKLSRRDELDRQITALALEPGYRELVGRIRCFRALDAHSAMVLTTEVVDFRRFASPLQLMAYFGLVPSEHSSGERRRVGAITKAGNAHCRHVLIQAAWSYRHQPAIGAALKQRQAGQDPTVIGHAWKAQLRCYKLFHRVASKRPAQVAAVAVARELVGFLWAVLQDVESQRHAERAVA